MGTTQSCDVAPLDTSEAVAAGAMLSRAFAADPMWISIVPDPERRPEILAGMFAAVTRTTIAARGIAEKTAGLAGVALWLPPGKEFGFWAMARSGFALPRFSMDLPKKDRKRMMTALGQIDARKKVVMPDAHWYVTAIGVDPDFQGKGFGTALMQHGMRRADEDSKPIYLETDTDTNVGFYRSLGFDVIEEFTPLSLGVRMWLMARRVASKHR